MSQEKGLDQSMSNQFCKFDDMIEKWNRLVSLVTDKAQHLNKHNKQFQRI